MDTDKVVNMEKGILGQDAGPFEEKMAEIWDFYYKRNVEDTLRCVEALITSPAEDIMERSDKIKEYKNNVFIGFRIFINEWEYIYFGLMAEKLQLNIQNREVDIFWVLNNLKIANRGNEEMLKYILALDKKQKALVKKVLYNSKLVIIYVKESGNSWKPNIVKIWKPKMGLIKALLIRNILRLMFPRDNFLVKGP
jgi:hypothetical protein